MSSFGVSRYLAARFRISSIAATARCRRSLDGGIDSSNAPAADDGGGVGTDGSADDGAVVVEDSFGVGVGIVIVIAAEQQVDPEEVPCDDGGGGRGSATTVMELFRVSVVVVASFFFSSFLCFFFVTSAESGQGGGWEEDVLGGTDMERGRAAKAGKTSCTSYAWLYFTFCTFQQGRSDTRRSRGRV